MRPVVPRSRGCNTRSSEALRSRKARLWRLVYGPDWEASVRAADPGHERFEDNLRALLDGFEISPYLHARELTPGMPDDRYGTTRDVAGGYRLVVFVHVTPAKGTCTLAWCAREDL
jgi:hypothetical protein